MMRKKGYLYGLLSGFFWGADGTLSSYLLMLPVLALIDKSLVSATLLIGFLHDAISTILMTGIVVRKNITQRRSIRRLISSKSLYFIIIAAIFAGPVGMRANLIAISKIGAGLSSTLTATYPAVSALFAVLFLKESLSRRNMIGLALTIVSVVILGYSGVSLEHIDYRGFLFALLCVIGWASESVICSYGMKDDILPEEALLIRQLTSSLVSLAMLLYSGHFFKAMSLLNSPSVILLCFLLAIVGTASYLFYYKAIDEIGAVKATGLNVTYSIWAVLFSLVVFGGAIDWRLLLCGLLIILGSSLVVNE